MKILKLNISFARQFFNKTNNIFLTSTKMSSDFASKLTSFPSTLNTTESLNTLKDIRAHYGDPSEIFDVKDLASKDPIKQFNDWFQIARKNPGIKEPVRHPPFQPLKP